MKMIGTIVGFILQKYLQKYNHLQPSDVADFSTVSIIINQLTYLSQRVRTFFSRGPILRHMYITTKNA